MLTKHTEIEIPPDNPFANDQLERKKIAENLTHLVESTNQPFVISIEAPWGWGKTTFINMWKSEEWGRKIKIVLKCLSDKEVIKRMLTIIGLLKKYPDNLGYGLYLSQK